MLMPLAAAQDALARLEASAAAASEAVQEGLRTRIALREAAGWLAHHGTWIHPTDLALREAGLGGSYTAAAMGQRLPFVLPATTGDGRPLEEVPEDLLVDQALALARLWRRLAELRSWSPWTEEVGGHEVCGGGLVEAEAQGWRGRLHRSDVPALALAGQAVQAAPAEEGRGDRLSVTAVLLAAWLWREAGFGRPLSLPFWSATPQKLHRLALTVGDGFLTAFLDCLTDAAQRARRELDRLQQAEGKAAGLRRTARSHLSRAAEIAVRVPVLTASTLAARLGVSRQAALALIKQLITAGVLGEVTGRTAWRGFAVL